MFGSLLIVALYVIAQLGANSKMPDDIGPFLGVVLGLALVSQVAGQSLITYGIRQLPVSFTAVALLIQPFYAALVAWAALGEAPTLMQVIGGSVILGGIILARPRRTAAPRLRA